MTITGKASHLSHSPRKVNLVVKAIVGMNAADALTRLEFTPKRAASAVAKVLKQAVANATNSFSADPKQLKIQSAFATKGRVLKRGHIGGRSRYKPYQKTFAHLTINLISTEANAAPAKPAVKAQLKTPVVEEAVVAETKTKTTKSTPKKVATKSKTIKSKTTKTK